MTVVVVAPGADEHARAVVERLQASGVAARLFDTHRFPGELRISLGADPAAIDLDGERVVPSSVYVRDLGLDAAGQHARLDDAMAGDWRRTMAALRERADFVLSIVHRWEALGIPVYNPLSAFPRITKPYQLALLAAADLPVPDSLWTNDPDAVRRFAAGRRIAYKPVAGGALTKELLASDLEPARLDRLRASPVCFQELLGGRDVRVYIVDGKVACAIEIGTGAIDFRQDEQSHTRFEPDAELRRICTRATEVLGLRFTGMDLKADAAGRLKILELNPSPMFLGFDRRAGSDILGALCAALAGRPTLATTA